MVEKRMVEKFFSAAGNEYDDKKNALRADVAASLEGLVINLSKDRAPQLFLRCIRDDNFWDDFEAERARLRSEYINL